MNSKTKTKQFHIGDVLSITTGRLVSTRKMDGVVDILSYMTGDKLWTHQLPRASDECKPWLIRQHPKLNDVDVISLDAMIKRAKDQPEISCAIDAWLVQQAKLVGEYLEIEPIPADDHTRIHPHAELVQMVESKPRQRPVQSIEVQASLRGNDVLISVVDNDKIIVLKADEFPDLREALQRVRSAIKNK